MPETSRQIADDIRARIYSGELAPGDRLPGEPTLVKQYGVAKMTANQALKLLVSEGLADHFTLEVLGGAPDPWCVALPEGQLAAAAAEAEKVLLEPNIDLNRWFRGDRRGILPWSGYSLGWRLAGGYLARIPDGRASRLARVPADLVIAETWSRLVAAPPVTAG